MTFGDDRDYMWDGYFGPMTEPRHEEAANYLRSLQVELFSFAEVARSKEDVDRQVRELKEAQVEALTEEIEALEKDNVKLSDSLKETLIDVIVKEKTDRGEYEDKTVEDKKLELSSRTLDSLRDTIKDMEANTITPNQSLQNMGSVTSPVFSVDNSKKDTSDKNLNKKKVYATFDHYTRVKGRSYAKQWLARVQKENNIIITLD